MGVGGDKWRYILDGWEWVVIFYGWVGVGRGRWRYIFVGQGGSTFFMGEWEWVGVGESIFWVGGGG